MHARRAPKPRTTRLIAGLAAAALGAGGIAGLAAPASADPGAYPYDLSFEPTQLLAADDAVFAVGTEYDGNYDPVAGRVAKVGAAPIDLGAGSSISDAALTRDGSTLIVLGAVAGDGPRTWVVDTATLAVEDNGPMPFPVDVIGTDAVGIFAVGVGSDVELRYDEAELVHFGDHNSVVSDAAATGEVGDRTWYVGGGQWDEDGASATATLWSVSETGAGATDVVLGAPGSPDSRVTALAVDPTSATAYVASEDYDDGTQGLTIVHGADATYMPLDQPVEDLAVSADGDTLYLSNGYQASAVPTSVLDSELDISHAWRDLDVWNASVAAGDAGELFVAGASDDGAGQVLRFATPAGAPANMTAAPDAYSTEAISVSWDQGKYSWEREDRAEYVYALFKGEPSSTPVTSGATSDQVLYLDGLAPGTTYTVMVARTDGPLAGEPVTAEVTTYARYVGAPSAIAIQGSLTVGSTLNAVPTGAWEDGADVTYEWFGTLPDAQSSGPVIATGPSLPLTQAHLGMAIYVVATGTKQGVATVSLASAPNLTTRVANPAPPVTTTPTAPAPAPVVPKVLTAVTPKISGKAKVGQTLTAEPGSWTAGAKLTYQWEAGGKPIKNATKRTLEVTKSLAGERITVTVTGSLAGYSTTSRTSAATDKVGGAGAASSKPGKGDKGGKGKPGKPGKPKPGKDKPGKDKPGKGHGKGGGKGGRT